MAAVARDPAVLLCCRCGRDESDYLNPQSKITISKLCGHGLCGGCLSSTFALFSKNVGGGTAHHRGHTTVRCPFPGCEKTLTAQDFVSKRPEEEEFEREKEIRRKLSRVFNRTLVDFNGDAAKFAEYQEQVETYTANLVSGVDIEATEAAIRKYVAQNQSSIAFNAARQDAASREMAAKIAAESQQRSQQLNKASEEEMARKAGLERVKSHLMTALLGDNRLPEAERAKLKAKLIDLHLSLKQAQKGPRGSSGAAAASTGAANPSAFWIPRRELCRGVDLPKRLPAPSSAGASGGGGAGGVVPVPTPADLLRTANTYQGIAAASPSSAGIVAGTFSLLGKPDEKTIGMGLERLSGGFPRDQIKRWQEEETRRQLWVLPR